METILFSLAGGALIGLAAVSLLAFNGKIAGISGIVGGLLAPSHGDGLWRLMFVVGLIAGGAVMVGLHPAAFAGGVERSLPAIAIAGLLVGYGTRLGNGCTSGHGVCGVSRMSPRSIVATASFIVAGVLTVSLTRLVFGGVL